MKFYQACFGKPNNVNWALFNLSNNMPPALSSFYEKAENSNTPQNLNNDDMVDRNGKPLCMYEILTQDNMVAVSRIQYGIRDNMGRPTMFAHGFLFDEEADVLRDPNTILAITDENFKFDSESTKIVAEQLELGTQYTLKSAMEECGINEENLIKLMSCIYISLTSATNFPLYLVSKEKEKILKPLTYCIYSLIPYSLRYNLSVSSANNFSRAQFKNIMFVDKKYNSGYFFDLETYETDMDFSDLHNHPEKYPFITQMKANGIESFHAYCDTIYEELGRMQMSDTKDYNVLKLADTFLGGTEKIKSMDDQELTRFLLETSAYAPMQNNYIDTFIAEITENYYERGLVPNESLMRRLEIRNEKTSSQQLVNIYKQVQMKVLMESGTNSVVKFLGEQRIASWDRFVDWCKYVENIEDGITMIEKYYELRISACNSLREVVDVSKEAEQLIPFTALYRPANDRCAEITTKRLKANKDFRESNSEILEEYSRVFAILNPAKGGKECREYIELFVRDYWKNFDLRWFEFDDNCVENCRCMELETEKSNTYRVVNMFIVFYDFLQRDDVVGERPLREIAPDIEDITNYIEKRVELENSILENIIPKLQGFIARKLTPYGRYSKKNFVFWFDLARFGYKLTRKNPLRLMLEWELPVLLEDERFADAMNDEFAKRVSSMISAIEGSGVKKGYLEDFDPKSEEYKLLKKRLNEMYNLENQIEKDRKKEEARARKEEEKLRKEELKALKEEEKARKEELKREKSDRRREKQDEFELFVDEIEIDESPKKESKKSGFSLSNFFGGKKK